MDKIIGDGPINLGRHHYPSRFELKTKLRRYLSGEPFGRVAHPVAIEKLSLIWGTTKQSGPASEFWVVPGHPHRRLHAVIDGITVDFDYTAAIDRIRGD